MSYLPLGVALLTDKIGQLHIHVKSVIKPRDRTINKRDDNKIQLLFEFANSTDAQAILSRCQQNNVSCKIQWDKWTTLYVTGIEHDISRAQLTTLQQTMPGFIRMTGLDDRDRDQYPCTDTLIRNELYITVADEHVSDAVDAIVKFLQSKPNQDRSKLVKYQVLTSLLKIEQQVKPTSRHCTKCYSTDHWTRHCDSMQFICRYCYRDDCFIPGNRNRCTYEHKQCKFCTHNDTINTAKYDDYNRHNTNYLTKPLHYSPHLPNQCPLI